MKTFTFSKLSKMGEFDEKWGVTYWGETNEQLEPVKFNSMNQNITYQDAIETEEVLLKTSSKGTEYHQLKKVRVVLPPKGQRAMEVQLSDAYSTTPSQLDRIEHKLDRLLGEDDAPES